MEITKTPKIYSIANPFWAAKRSLDFEKFKLMFEKYQVLPENIKIIITDQESADVIWQIGQKNKFIEEQVSKLAIIVWGLLSAEIPIAGFIPAIAEELNIAPEIARSIAQEINVKIFSKAAMQIKRLQESKFGNQETRNKKQETNENQKSKIKNQIKSEMTNQNQLVPQVRRPEERVVNLQNRVEEKPKFVDPGPKIEGNIVDLSE